MNTGSYLSKSILIVDDNISDTKVMQLILEKAGYKSMVACQDSDQVMKLISDNAVGIVLLNLEMSKISGNKLLDRILQEHSEMPVIIVSSKGSIKKAVNCMKAGAFDYIEKPIDNNRLAAIVKHASKINHMQNRSYFEEKHRLEGPLENPEVFKSFITKSHVMIELFKYAEAIAPSARPVLITGETGVGKELMSRLIHTLSHRKGRLVPINVAGLDDNMFSDTLFGHVRGAFTGAETVRNGLISQASNGTLFLDEIGDLNLASQVKLLRLIQESEYYSLGGDQPQKTNARIVAATNKNLWQMQREGRFREDLNHRIRAHHIHIPPLRERKEDIRLLIEHFLEEEANHQKKKQPTPPKELYEYLELYDFPGNVRELKHMIADAVSQHKHKVLSLESFKKRIASVTANKPGSHAVADTDAMIVFPGKLPTRLQALSLLIDEAMRRANGNQTIAARMLQMSQQAISKHLKMRYNIHE